MRQSLRVFSLCIFLLFTSCHINPEKNVHHLVLKTVYEIAENPDSSSVQKLFVNTDTSYIEYIFKGYDLVDIKTLDSTIVVDLQYSDTGNFIGRNFYDGLKKAYFTCDMAIKLCAAQYYLKQRDTSLSLVIFDATRPQHLQQMMWDSLKMEPVQKMNYLSNPEMTSMHNYGCAVDLSIINTTTDSLLDMGTGFDAFQKLSQPFYEIGFLRSGQLSQEAYLNRLLLRKVMKDAGLNPITSEWWHFSLCTREEAVKRYALIK
jgi:D-alanyl-D-alanine dipeptidase